MHLRCHSAAQEQADEIKAVCLSRLKTSERHCSDSFRPLQRLSWCIPRTARVDPELRTWPTSWCYAEPAHTHEVCGRGRWRPVLLGRVTHQGVVQADVSLQTALFVFKLHNRHFGCCDGQNVPQTCGVGS